MNIREKKKKLFELYDAFEAAVRPYLESAVCKTGCADCCTTVGEVSASTLEGVFILEYMKSLPQFVQKDLKKKLKKNRQQKREFPYVPCAFLTEDRMCSIYPVRPFSCRRLYSVRVCGETGPTVHRDVWKLAGEFETKIRLLDDTGCCGHLSYILALLNESRFFKAYLEGEFFPEELRELALSHHVVVNRFADHLQRTGKDRK